MSALGNGPDEDGLYRKYDVTRLDRAGDPVADGKHDDCWLFVLDPAHDREALYALMRYAELCINHGKYALGHALFDKIEEVQKASEYRTE